VGDAGLPVKVEHDHQTQAFPKVHDMTRRAVCGSQVALPHPPVAPRIVSQPLHEFNDLFVIAFTTVRAGQEPVSEAAEAVSIEIHAGSEGGQAGQGGIDGDALGMIDLSSSRRCLDVRGVHVKLGCGMEITTQFGGHRVVSGRPIQGSNAKDVQKQILLLCCIHPMHGCERISGELVVLQ